MNDPKPPQVPSSVATEVPAPSPAKVPFEDPASSEPASSEPARAGSGSDPQAGVDTREHSLDDLRAAARLAERDEVDLVEAERAEAEESAQLDSSADPDAGEPEPGPVDDLANLSPIDPRIRERRVAVTRAEGRRRLRILLSVMVVGSAIGIAWLIVQSPFLALKTINVRGAARESAADVQNAAGVKEGTALLFVDTGAVARRVEELPWVAQAKVERELPTTLSITVVERLPVAWARRPAPKGSPEGTLGAIVLVDRSGRVLGDEAQPPVGLPELIGVARVPDRGDQIEPAALARRGGRAARRARGPRRARFGGATARPCSISPRRRAAPSPPPGR